MLASRRLFRRLFTNPNSAAIEVGDVLRARRPVNARPGPAGPQAYVLPTNAIIVVGEIRPMPLPNGGFQRWARLDLSAD